MTASPPTTLPRRWHLQFSLRLLLLALTAFAIAFPIGYRWPYEEEQLRSQPGATPIVKKITTWQRQWGGGRRKHGAERVVAGDKIIESVTYRGDSKHGPMMRVTRRGSRVLVTITGRYENDLKHGVWSESCTQFKRTDTWHEGKLDGPYEIELADGSQTRMTFVAGKLTHFNGKPARNRLIDLCESGVLDDVDQTSAELSRPTKAEFIETPLRDVLIFLQEAHGLTMFLDSKQVRQPDVPITADCNGMDLISVLTLLTTSHNLSCDFRYGLVWITTAKDIEHWHDPTGVAQIEPKNGTALARAWNEPATLAAINQPLAPVLATIAQPLAIEIDTSQIDPTADNPNAFAITANTKSLPFRHILGLALYQTNCRCKLEGETLVITPSTDKP